MPRSRKRTTNKASWSIEAMNAALNEIKNNEISIRAACKKYELPYSSIRDRLKSGSCTAPKLGRSPFFTAAQEEEIASHLLFLSKLFYGVTQKELRRVMYEYAERNKIANKFNTNSKLAGVDWFYDFLKRNPNVSIRKPEATSVNRVQGFNRNEIKLFYDNLELLMERYNFPPEKIFNVDETGISTVQKPCKILAEKGQKQVGAVTSWERGKNHTVCCAISASGQYIPPMFIYPRQRMTPALERGGPPGSLYACTKSGWMTEELFLEWLKHFAKIIHASKQEPVLLILDNHTSHISLSAYNFCKDHGIHMLSLPPHTSHRTQPLDVTVFGPLKSALNREFDLFIKSRQYQQITPYDLASLFNKAYSRIATIEKAVSGFKTTGIYPLDPNIFEEEAFLPSDLLAAEIENLPKTDHQSESQKRNERSPTICNVENSSAADELDVNISIKDLLPVPGPSNNPKKRATRPKQHSQILTSTPIKETLVKKQEKRVINSLKKTKNMEKKIKRVKRKIVESSSSESGEDKVIYDDDELDDLAPNEFCAICNEFGKDEEMWFRCTVCGNWIHQECSGTTKAKNYICDLCI